MYNYPTFFSTSLASGVTLGSSVDLGYGWGKMSIAVPTMASGDLYFQGSADNINFYRIIGAVPPLNILDVLVPSTVTQRVFNLAIEGIRYIKIESTSGCTDVVTTYKFICA